MTKKSLLWILLDLIFVVVFNVVFFVSCGADNGSAAWLSYGFIHFAYLMSLLTPLLTQRSANSFLAGLTIAEVTGSYFIVELIIGMVFIFCEDITIKTAIIVQTILAGIYLFILFSTMLANEDTEEKIEKSLSEISYIKECTFRVQLLRDRAKDPETRKVIEKLYDLLHACPSKSNDDAKAIEDHIWNRIAELEKAISIDSYDQAKDIAKDITFLVNVRNNKLQR